MAISYLIEGGNVNSAAMPRKNATYRLDDRLIALISDKAQEQNTSANRWLENKLIELFRLSEDLPQGFKPVGEMRGKHERTPKSEVEE
jgi:hypothetical protein